MQFGVISLTASEFMAHAIRQVQKMTRMSDSLMGVTFLALGNGVGDLVGSFIGINVSD